MANKNSLAKAKDIRAGKSCYVFAWDSNGDYFIKKIVIKRVSSIYGRSKSKIIYASGYRNSTGDRGVVGHAYDKRPTQIFNNKRSAQFWLDHYVKLMSQGDEWHFNFFVRGIHN